MVEEGGQWVAMVEEGEWLPVHDGYRVVRGDDGFLLLVGDGILSWHE